MRHTNLLRVRRRAARVVAAVAVAGMAIALGVPGGTSVGDAASPFVAGVPSPTGRRSPATGPPLPLLVRRTSRAPGPAESGNIPRRTGRRPFDGSAYDEVTESDATGRALGLHRFDARGASSQRRVRVAGGGRPTPAERRRLRVPGEAAWRPTWASMRRARPTSRRRRTTPAGR